MHHTPELILCQSPRERLYMGRGEQGLRLLLEQPCPVAEGARFRERLRLFSGVLHPGFVRVLGGGWSAHPGRVELVLEEVPGLPVSGLPGAWRSAGVAQVMAQVSGIVAAVHALGLGIGGLSPARVLLSRRQHLVARVVGFAPIGSIGEDLRSMATIARELAQDQPLHPELAAALAALERAELDAAGFHALCARLSQPKMAPKASPAPMPTDAPTTTPAAL